MSLSQEAQTLVDRFTACLTADQRANFESVLRDSESLVEQINQAVASGGMREFALLAPDVNAGGQYDPAKGAIELPAAILSAPTTPQGAPFDASELTFVMSHEVQHAINTPKVDAAYSAFGAEIERIAASTDPTHDYTQALDAILSVNRNDEATANIAGYNATVEMLRNRNGGRDPTLAEIYESNPRMQDVIGYTPGTTPPHAVLPGFSLNADMTVTANADNVEAMAQSYFDKPAIDTGLGPNGGSDYQNYYATDLIEWIASNEQFFAPDHAADGRSPQLHIDMHELRLDEAQLEHNELDLGGVGATQAYYDTSTDPPTQGTFDHTAPVEPQTPNVGLNGQRSGHEGDAPDEQSAGHEHGDRGQELGSGNAGPNGPDSGQSGPGEEGANRTPDSQNDGQNQAPHGQELGGGTPGGSLNAPDTGTPECVGHAPEGATPPPTHPLLREAIEALDRSPNIPADAFGDQRASVAAGVAMHAANQHLRTDHIVLDSRHSDLLAVEGGLSDPSARIATPLPLAEALKTDLQAAQHHLETLRPTSPAGHAPDLTPQQIDSPVLESARVAR